MRRALARRPIPGLDLIGSILVSLAFTAAAMRTGLSTTLFGALLLGSILLTLISPKAFALLVVVLAPLPSLGALVGRSIPLGLDPLDALVFIGLSVAVLRDRPLAVRRESRLVWLVALNLLALAIAWYRTYGRGVNSSSLGLLVKPVIVVLAALSVLQLLEQKDLVPTVSRAMGWALVVIGFSVVLQRLGLYRTVHQSQYEQILGAKQYGGLMLNGNSAGVLFAVFALPTYVLLRKSGSLLLGRAVLVLAIAVLLISLSRSAIAGAAAGLLALAVLKRRRLEGIRVALALAAVAAVGALTLGKAQLAQLKASVSSYQTDPNGALSGRLAIWHQARAFLSSGNHLLFGGGLDSFKAYALASPLEHAFATHNEALRLLTTGGVVMLALFVALVVGLWLLGRTPDPDLGLALRIALLSLLVVGLTLDADVFDRAFTWLWLLVALAAYERTLAAEAAASTAAMIRGAIASAPQGRSGARTASVKRSSEEAPT
ncbi:MAG: O-antigen ligase family protein [Gaiellaceae bacterium]